MCPVSIVLLSLISNDPLERACQTRVDNGAAPSCRAAQSGSVDACAILCAPDPVARVANRMAAKRDGSAECADSLPTHGAAARHWLCVLLGPSTLLGGHKDVAALELKKRPPCKGTLYLFDFMVCFDGLSITK